MSRATKLFLPIYAYVDRGKVLCVFVLILCCTFQAVQRDMKDYIRNHSPRLIPVGYSAADVRDILMDTVNYMSCQLSNATTSRSDFVGLNSYSWCGDSNYKISGYNILTDDFSNASLPVFFSEYGCNQASPRIFTEVEALYGEEMSRVFSGGLVYEYSQELNNYGLVFVGGEDKITLLEDYENLQRQYGKLDMKRLKKLDKMKLKVEPQECSSELIKSIHFLNTFELPSRPHEVQEMIDQGYGRDLVGLLVPIETATISESVCESNGTVIPDIKMSVLNGNVSNSPAGGILPDGYANGTTTTQHPKGGGNASGTKSDATGGARIPLFLGLTGIAFVALDFIL